MSPTRARRTRTLRLTHLVAVGTLAVTLSACGGDGDAAPPLTTTDADVTLTADDTLKFDRTEVSAEAGEITFQLTNAGAVPHDIAIEQADDIVVAEAGGGETTQGTITLDAGTYTFYCSIVGHREAGMEGTLTVE